MNVRFFAGTKEQYLSIANHNPIALYFCSDTRELFWGDRLLSDGIRVVPTKNDLPSFTSAADGVIYYVVDTRAGYVLSSDRASWIQTIYAPTDDITVVPENEAHNTAVSVAAIREIENTIYEKLASIEALNKVKEISFAGVALDKADGVFSIDRDVALKALGISFAEGPIDTDAKVVTTKAYVDNKIATLPKVDLDGYAKQEDLAELASERFVEEFVKQQILEAELNDKDADLSIFYTKSEIDKLIPDTTNFVEKDELKGLASEEFVSEAIKAIEFPGTDLSGLATKEELTEAIKSIEHPVTDLTEYVKREELDSFITEIPDNYVTEEELEAKGYLTEVPEVDLSAYYTKSEVDGLIPSVPTKISELENNVGFVTASDIPSLDGYAKIEDLPTDYLVETDLAGYAKLTDIPDVSTFISEIPAEYITETELEEKGYLTEHQDISDLVTKDELRAAINSVEHPTVDLTGYATETYVNEAISGIEIPEFDLSGYALKSDIPDVSKFITDIPEQYITAEELAAEGFIKEHQDLSEYAKAKVVVAQKYEVLPVEGMLISYRGDEVRLNTQRVTPVHQNVGQGGNPNTFNVTFRAYAPEGATKVIKGVIDGNTGVIEKDSEAVALATDAYGRKYATMWAATAMYTGASWLDYGSLSTVEKYLGHRYVFEWYNEEQLIGADRFNIVLTNDNCHNDAVPAEVIKRINDKIKAIDIPEVDLAGYATEQWVAEQGFAKASDIPSVDKFVTEDFVTDAIANINIDHKADADHKHDDLYDAKGAAEAIKNELLGGAGEAFDTLKELNELIAENKGTIEALAEVATNKADKSDLEILATKEEVAAIEAKIPSVDGFISEIPSEYITEAELEAKGYLTEHQSLEGFATEEFVSEAIATIELPDAELYKVDFNAPNFAKAVEAYKAGKVLLLINAAPDVNSYALMNYVSDSYITFTKFLTNRSETYGAFNTYYLSADNTWEVSKEVKISKVEANVDGEIAGQLKTIKINKETYSIPSTDGLASEAYVTNAINNIPDPDLSEYAKLTDIPETADFATKDELSEAIANIEHPDADLTNYVTKDEIEGFISNIPEEFITEAELEAKGYLTEHQSLEAYALKSDIPSIEGLATEQFVEEAINAIEMPDVPTNVSAFTNDAGYITDVSNKANIEHTHTLHEIVDYVAPIIPSLEGYATEQFVEEAVAGIEIPKTDLTNYYTKEETATAIELKADKVPFTTSKFVTKAIGGFAIGDDVMGLTVAQLFAKLLELSDNAVDPDEPNEPEIPEEPSSIADKIIANKLVMYSVNANNELVATSDITVTKMTPEEAKAAPTTAGFYQIVSDGEVIESGYQELQIKNGDVYYVFALPKIVDYASMVEYQSYDAEEEKWLPGELTDLYSDPETVAALCDEVGIDISHIDTSLYTVYAQEAECTGKQIRFIIKEAN